VRKIVVSIRNGLLSEAVIRTLSNCGEFLTYPASPDTRISIPAQCQAINADILLMEVSYTRGTTAETRMEEIRQLHRGNPGCKVVLLCDDQTAPDIASKVTQLRKDRLIDGFLFTSVSESYLQSSLVSM